MTISNKPTIRESLLTDEDILLIKKRRNISVIIIVAATLMMDAICAIMFFSQSEANALIITGLIFTITFGLVAWYIYKVSEKDFDTGTKYIITGIVLKKEISGGKTKEYIILFEGEKIKVTWKQYKEIVLGDKVEIHYTRHSKTSLSFKKLF